MLKTVAIVIPIYTNKLSKYEIISLNQNLKIFKNRPVYLAVPKGFIPRITLTPNVKTAEFPAEYFANVNSYSKLLRSLLFYDTFKDYVYILIAQLDTFVFFDRLDEWCSKDYDYIGAPWIFEISKFIPDFLKSYVSMLHRHRIFRFFRRFTGQSFLVGNGGFSLRKVKTFIDVLEKQKDKVDLFEKQMGESINTGLNLGDNEDAFWSLFVKKIYDRFKVADFSKALEFAFEASPEKCYLLNKKKLPFGCHGWEKHNMNFWKQHIEKEGYNLEPEHGEGSIDSINTLNPRLVKGRLAFGKLKLSGWIFDPSVNRPFDAVTVSLGPVRIKADYGIKRHDLAFYKKNYALRECGFEANFDISRIGKGPHTLIVEGRSGERTFSIHYEHQIYTYGNILIEKALTLYRVIKEKGKAYKKLPNLIFSLMRNIFKIMQVRNEKDKFIIVSLTEHMGDIAACEPVSRVLKEQYPDKKQVWVTNYRYSSIIEFNPDISAVLTVTSIFEWSILKKISGNIKVVDLHIDGKPCSSFPMALKNRNSSGITIYNYYDFGTLLDVMMLSAGMKNEDIAPIFHFDPALNLEVPVDTIIFHCSSNEVQRNWDDDKWNELAATLLKKGYKIAEVGFKNRIKQESDQYRNYCGRYSLQEIAMLIKKSVLFVGIDSSFAHFANATGTSGVILLGYYRDFKKYMPYTGEYKNGKNADIIQYDGYVQDLPLSIVLNKIEERLKKR